MINLREWFILTVGFMIGWIVGVICYAAKMAGGG